MELVADVGEGFYVADWLGGNADVASGDFPFGFRGQCITDGAIGVSVSEMNLTGNYLVLLGQLVGVGNDRPLSVVDCAHANLGLRRGRV